MVEGEEVSEETLAGAAAEVVGEELRSTPEVETLEEVEGAAGETTSPGEEDSEGLEEGPGEEEEAAEGVADGTNLTTLTAEGATTSTVVEEEAAVAAAAATMAEAAIHTIARHLRGTAVAPLWGVAGIYYALENIITTTSACTAMPCESNQACLYVYHKGLWIFSADLRKNLKKQISNCGWNPHVLAKRRMFL